MEYQTKVYVETHTATSISSNYDNFVGTLDFDTVDKAEQWRRAYFELLSWKNTWGTPYSMDIYSRHDHTPYLNIVVPTDSADALVDVLEQMGYGNVTRYDIEVGVVETPFHPDDSVEIWDFYFE